MGDLMLEYKNDSFRRNCIGTEVKFALLPHRCYLSNRLIWLKFAYRQMAMYSGPGDVIYDERWYNKHEFLIAKLKEQV
jgi:hypothetical protein